MRDVLVIGGGPIGSYLASRLAGIGLDVLVLEKRAGLGNKVCCAGIISQECLDSFALGNGLVLRRGNSARVFPPSGRPVGLWREKTQACIVGSVGIASLAIRFPNFCNGINIIPPAFYMVIVQVRTPCKKMTF